MKMPLNVNGTWAERQKIMGWLRQICGRVSVDRDTGVTDLSTPSPAGYATGCDCIQGIINSHRTVTIQPLPSPDTPIPGHAPMTLDGTGGGATTVQPGGQQTPAGAPGTGPDGAAGTDATVWIDISNHDGHGYDHGFPMWFVLAHELTTGHASHQVAGTAGRTSAAREKQAIECEHAHALAHPRLPLRDPDDPSRTIPYPE
jgi:hypothetical protein